jgi:TetR/AcrR family transcriptional regulator, cholesterol catabolism regulator
MKDEVWEFKRERILDEAIPLFAEFGFQGVSIDKIAKNLKVTKPFIYTYFKNKEALLDEIYERGIQSLMDGLEHIFASNKAPQEELKQLVEFYVLENIRNANITMIFLNEERNLSPESQIKIRAKHHNFDSQLAALIRKGAKAGVFEVDDPMLASLAISGMVRWVHRWYKADGRLKPQQVARKFSGYALNVVRYDPKAGT